MIDRRSMNFPFEERSGEGDLRRDAGRSAMRSGIVQLIGVLGCQSVDS
jgi:hypothetical protein